MALTLLELKELDDSILDDFALPFLSIDDCREDWNPGWVWHNEVFRPNLIMQCGQLETIFSNPAEFKKDLEMWSKMRFSVWYDLLRTTVQKYSLLHNYDRTEEIVDERNEKEMSSLARLGKVSNNSNDSGSGSSSNESSTSGDSTENSTNAVSAYNSAELAVKDKNTRTSNGTNSGTASSTYNEKSQSYNSGTSEMTDKGSKEISGNNTRKVRAYGNIGTTTTQQMLKEERELVVFSVSQFIIDDFKKQFCILVY